MTLWRHPALLKHLLVAPQVRHGSHSEILQGLRALGLGTGRAARGHRTNGDSQGEREADPVPLTSRRRHV
jgi:hypothetical protein